MKRFSLTLLLATLLSIEMSAQSLLTNQNALMSIGTNVPFVVEGSVTNSGSILNEGDLRLSGDWSSDGDYSSVSGTFTLNGDNQLFTPGSSVYHHVAINSSGVVIMSDLSISNSLELTNGIVSVVTDSKILLREDATIIGGSETAYIDGALFTTTTGNFTFPVGTEFEYIPITLTNIQSSDSVGVRATSSQLDVSTSREIDAYSPNRYWQIWGGESFNAESITLPIFNESFIESLEEAVIAFTQQVEDPLSIFGVPTTDGSLSSGSISSAGRIASGYYLLADQSVTGPPITVINVVTSMQDGKHDFLRIENIEFYEENLVEIFDRQGVKVFEMSGYNNTDRVFRGNANIGSRSELVTGNYYYTVKLTSSKRESGFVYIKN